MSGVQRYRPRSRRHTVARHGRLRTPRGPGLVAKVLAIALCVFVVSGASVAAVATSHLAHAVHQISATGRFRRSEPLRVPSTC